MLHYLPQLNNIELCELFLEETKRFMEGLDSNISHNELASIRLTIKQIMDEMEKRKERKSLNA